MANSKSIIKVLEYLKTRKSAVSPSEISFSLNMRYKSVKDCLKILAMNQQIIFLEAGKGFSLIQFKESKNDN